MKYAFYNVKALYFILIWSFLAIQSLTCNFVTFATLQFYLQCLRTKRRVFVFVVPIIYVERSAEFPCVYVCADGGDADVDATIFGPMFLFRFPHLISSISLNNKYGDNTRVHNC